MKQNSSLTEYEIMLMRYCLGLDRGTVPRRNRCSVARDDVGTIAVWQGLVSKRLAWLADTSESNNVYSLTRRGRAVLAFKEVRSA
jgi:hypothetical protein